MSPKKKSTPKLLNAQFFGPEQLSDKKMLDIAPQENRISPQNKSLTDKLKGKIPVKKSKKNK